MAEYHLQARLYRSRVGIEQNGFIDDGSPLDCATAVHEFIRDRLAAGLDLEDRRIGTYTT